jgi:transposase-like protein
MAGICTCSCTTTITTFIFSRHCTGSFCQDVEEHKKQCIHDHSIIIIVLESWHHHIKWINIHFIWPKSYDNRESHIKSEKTILDVNIEP